MIRSRRSREPLTRPEARRKRRRRAYAAILVVAVAVGGTAYATWSFIEENEYLLDERCEVSSPGEPLRMEPEQAHNAAILAASAVQRGLPAEAAVDVVAFSLQEADLTERHADDENPVHRPADASEEEAAEGQEEPPLEDRQLFARGGPSWDAVTEADPVSITVGTVYADLEEAWDPEAAQDSDPQEAADEGSWVPSLTVEQAAEVLERPHDPSFYPQHAERARAFAWPLAGQQPLGMMCQLGSRDAPSADPAGARAELEELLPDVVEFEGEEDETEEDPEALHVQVPTPEAGTDHQWLVAQWAVAAAKAYGIDSVAVGHYQWQRTSGDWVRSDESVSTAGEGTSEDRELVILDFSGD